MMNLILGDCITKMQSIESGTVDMICCDMPYGTTQCSWDSVIDLQLLWSEYKRVTKPNAAIVLFAQTPFDKVLGASNIEMLRYEWIWEKPAATGFLNAKRMPLKAHENILVFYDKLPKYNPQKTDGHERKTAGRKTVGSEVYGKAIKKVQYDSTERYPRSVQRHSKDNKLAKIHPTQKPLGLVEMLIKTYTDAGDLVLDSCMGSGTAGEACKNLGRRFIGIEIEEKYFNAAKLRLAV
jgi:site-specific DNA-methyltransferase (adenine-specific)